MGDIFWTNSVFHRESIRGIALNPFNECLIVFSMGCSLSFYDLVSMTFESRPLLNHIQSEIMGLESHGPCIVSWSRQSVVVLGSVSQLFDSVSQFKDIGTNLCSLSIHPDGLITVGLIDQSVRVFTMSFVEKWSIQTKRSILFLHWSPDGLLLAIALESDQLTFYDKAGLFIHQIDSASCAEPDVETVALSWSSSGLATFRGDGRVRIMRSVYDEDVISIDCRAQIIDGKWSVNGEFLAVASKRGILLFSKTGSHIRSLSLPHIITGGIQQIVWNSNNQEIFAALESCICIASIPQRVGKSLAKENCVVVTEKDSVTIYPSKLCVSITNVLDVAAGLDTFVALARSGESTEALLLSMETGEVLKRQQMIKMGPPPNRGVSFDGKLVVISSTHSVHIWDVAVDTTNSTEPWISAQEDSFVSSALSSGFVAVCRQSGLIHICVYDDTRLTHQKTIHVATRPERLYFNCNGTVLAVIDYRGKLFLIDTESGQNVQTTREHCWDLVWSADSPDILVCMDENKLYVLRGKEGKPEEPLNIEHNILLGLEDLEIITVNILRSVIEKFPSKYLRDCSKVIEAVTNLDDAIQYVSRRPHARLWTLVAEHALSQARFDVAMKCYSEAKNEIGVHVVNFIQSVIDPVERSVEIFLWLNRLDECHNFVTSRGRSDLLLKVKKRICDYEALCKLDNWQSVSNKTEMGNFFYMKGNLEAAADWYMRQESLTHLTKPHFISLVYANRYDDLISIARDSLASDDPMLLEVARIAGLSGRCRESAELYCKAGNVNGALSLCADWKRWDIVFEIESKYKVRYDKRSTAALVKEGKLVEALEVVKHAGDRQLFEQLNLLSRVEERYSLVDRYKISLLHGVELDSWRPARALYLLILAQALIHDEKYEEALVASLGMKIFQDVLTPSQQLQAFKLQALSALLSGNREACSGAVTKLQIFDETGSYNCLALRIFGGKSWKMHASLDTRTCPDCKGPGAEAGTEQCLLCGRRLTQCINTGKFIGSREERVESCAICASLVDLSANTRVHCPVCHNVI
jgi:hypothetical protein